MKWGMVAVTTEAIGSNRESLPTRANPIDYGLIRGDVGVPPGGLGALQVCLRERSGTICLVLVYPGPR